MPRKAGRPPARTRAWSRAPVGRGISRCGSAPHQRTGAHGGRLARRRRGRAPRCAVLDGYDSVLGWMAAPFAGRIRLASTATRVEWTRGAVAAYVRQPDGRLRFALEARAAIIAVPLGVLKADPGRNRQRATGRRPAAGGEENLTSSRSAARRVMPGFVPDFPASPAAPIAVGTRILRGRGDRRRLARRARGRNGRHGSRNRARSEGAA